MHAHKHTHPQVTTVKGPIFREEDSNRVFTALKAVGLGRTQLINELDTKVISKSDLFQSIRWFIH